MNNFDAFDKSVFPRVAPPCPVFGECGGCQYQDIPYDAELTIKEKQLSALFAEHGIVVKGDWSRIVPSPQEYGYRSRLDMKFLQTRDGKKFMGFSPASGKWLMEVDRCPIAMDAVSNFLPRLKEEASAKVTAKHRNANLVVKTGDDGRVFWGGVGKRSLKLDPKDYLWTEIHGRRIFYSLDTFFQSNLAILPLLMDRIDGFESWSEDAVFYDLYGGVGLFGIYFANRVKKVVLIEENTHSIEVAKHNIAHHGLTNVELFMGRVEDVYPERLHDQVGTRQVAMIDPPRQGLAESVAKAMAGAKTLDRLFYLSCSPESLVRDLMFFVNEQWSIRAVMPFDFFPRTRHLETLVVLEPPGVKI